MSEKINHQVMIPPSYQDQRLDQTLAILLPEYSRTQLKTWIDSGLVTVNGTPAKSKLRLKGGEQVVVMAEKKPPLTDRPQSIPLAIVHEDEDVLIINKPVGLVVHPGAGNQDSTLLNALLHHAPNLQALPRAGIVHRLDKDTSGLLIVAKTPSALKSLTHQLKKRKVVREYQAVVVGPLISGGTINEPIGRHPTHRTKMAISNMGKEAITHYRIMERYRAYTRLKLRLETGRTHQIRVHLAAIHHPIVGDRVYAGREAFPPGIRPELKTFLKQFKHQALHAFALGFTHPTSRQPMQFESELPADFQELITLLRMEPK